MDSYDPKKHKNVDLYQMVSKKFGEGIVGTVLEKVEDEATLEYAKKHPHWFYVKDEKE